MRPWPIAVGALALAVVVTVVAFALSAYIALSPECVDEVLTESASPDGMHTATVFRRNCGATAAFAYGVSLRSEADPRSATDVVLFARGPAPHFSIIWSADDRLEITSAGTKEYAVRADRWKEVEIVYSSPSTNDETAR